LILLIKTILQLIKIPGELFIKGDGVPLYKYKGSGAIQVMNIACIY
jgi:hypothetical protein